MAEQQHIPHALHLDERKKLTLTGVTEVVSFDEGSVVLCTSLGTLIVQGSGLQLKALTLDGGSVAVEGEVASLVYEQPRASGSWRSRLFG